jgi:cobalt/nickel transport protein
MSTQINVSSKKAEDSRFFDGFTKTMLSCLLFLLLVVFTTGKYMGAHNMKGTGTDDIVNDLSAAKAQKVHHPFIELPGDAELSAFSLANFFAGLIVGYHWLKLFGSKPQDSTKETTEN